MKYLKLILCFCLTTSSFAQLSQQFKTPSRQQLDSLKNRLELLFKKDQTFRLIYIDAENRLGKNSTEMDYFWEVVEAQDKVLEKEVIDIIEQNGWLGISQVGRLANTAQWAVLQHGTINSKEKYAPLLKASVLKDESQPSHYARLIDRMLVNSDKLQLYGTQINYDNDTPFFFPIKDPEFIDKRRQEIGLSSIKVYAELRKIEWIVPQD